MNDPEFPVTAADGDPAGQRAGGIADRIRSQGPDRHGDGQPPGARPAADPHQFGRRRRADVAKAKRSAEAGRAGPGRRSRAWGPTNRAPLTASSATRTPVPRSGLQFELPIGNREAAAIFRRAQLQRMQAIEQYRFLVSQVSQDVKTALRDVQASWEEIGARAAGALRRLRYAPGPRTARGAGRSARSHLRPAQAGHPGTARRRRARRGAGDLQLQHRDPKLERAKGTLLRYNNIVMQEENLLRRRGPSSATAVHLIIRAAALFISAWTR